MDIKSFPSKTVVAPNDYLLIQDATDKAFKHTTKEALLTGISGSGSTAWQVKTANYQAQPNDRIIADTTTNWILTLPSVTAPTDVEILGLPSVTTNNLLVQGLTKFEGKEVLSLLLNQAYRSVKLTYLDSSNGWIQNPSGIIRPNYLFNATSLPGLLLKVRSSEGVITSSEKLVSRISDISGLNNYLTQTTSTRQALLVENGFNSHSVIRFSDGTKWLDFINRLTNIRTIYWVIKHDSSSNYSFLLGDSSAYDFHSGSLTYFDSNSSSYIQSGNFRINGVTQSPISNRSFDMVTISLVATNNVIASAFSSDRNNAFGSRSWRGDLLYLAIYSQPHTVSQVEQMEAYLKSEYKHY